MKHSSKLIILTEINKNYRAYSLALGRNLKIIKILVIPLFAVLLFSGFKIGPVKTISGVVTAKEDGSPLPGVSVTSVPGKKVATTDANGKYSITVEDNATALRFAYIGYKTREVNIGKSSTLNIILQYDNKQLEEIVDTQYKSEKYRNVSPVMQGKTARI
ncbi:MAG: carboxypeptidase-like regulatory domain-containing protein, partial [Daejeonella sp.]